MYHLRKYARVYFLGALFFATGLIWYAVFRENRQGLMTVAFLNVGQGDSILIDSPAGNQMLIDGGPDKSVLARLNEILPFYDRTINVVLATHPDQDHIAGLVDVLSNYKVSYMVMTEATSSTAVFQSLLAAAQKSGAAVVRPRRGMVIHLGGGADFRIIFPDRDMAGQTDTNLASVVGKAELGKESFLLTGDSPQAIEHYEVSLDPKILKSDVLKPGHHGSDTSGSAEFIGVADPEYAVLSVGKGNIYGHPKQSTLDTLKQFGVKILRTDEQGTIVFKTGGETLPEPIFKP